MTPVVRLERDPFSRGRAGLANLAASMERKPERAPRLTPRFGEPAPFARVMDRLLKRDDVGRRVGSCRLEALYARIRQPDMRAGVIGHDAQRILEYLARADRLIAIECFERRTSINERSIRQKQRIERRIRLASLAAFHVRGEPVAFERQRFDEKRAIALTAERFAHVRDRLLDAIVADGHAAPRSPEERILRHDMPGVAGQQQQDFHMAIGKRDASASTDQTTSGRIELEGTEPENGVAAVHH